jgi:acetolactate synthase-1/2/3 large subunit
VQERVVERSNALVMAECGNAFVWANHLLRFAEPGRYRASVHFGSMGHMAAGVLGPAHTGRKAVALVGDGSMLMNNELSTAVAHGAPAVWIILNDGGYGMCQQGLQAVLGWSPHDLAIPTVDFTRVAAGLGANAMAVLTERELPSAIDRALAAAEPFVLDVHIDAAELSPAMARYAAIKAKVGSKPN